MSNVLGVSGSTIMSQKELFGELFTYGVSHLEIGEFKDKNEYNLMMNLIDENNYSHGIHSPIIRNMSKYDLAEEVFYSPKIALNQITDEAKKLSITQAKYLLVHFPYFENELMESRLDVIEDRLIKLKNIKDKYNIEIVCEPKLNGYMSPYSINMMNSIPISMWDEYDIKVCIDLGDYLIAAKERLKEMVYKWMDYIAVVHMHNVAFGERYRWIPIHPKDEQTVEYELEEIIRNIGEKNNVHFIMEPTPHIYKSKEYMLEGLEWVRSII